MTSIYFLPIPFGREQTGGYSFISVSREDNKLVGANRFVQLSNLRERGLNFVKLSP